eukprot:TRINITY_DN20382_c0_g1_i1.p1 TRINITY_DN20382_c0_g1~~TRINITY_DN20382_c0_g1_i1.p1  ORF type:complete len:403 (+),score=87.46 TRINITY_DN20382_c0_g1_i1:66-1274(+)
MSKKVIAFAGLVAVQLIAAIAYKSSQRKGRYEYSPASTLAVSEFFKFWISFAILVRSVVSQPLEVELDQSLSNQRRSMDEESQEDSTFLNRKPETRGGSSSVFLNPEVISLAIAKIKQSVTPGFLIQSFLLAALYFINNHIQFTLFLTVDPASINLFKSCTIFTTAILLRVMANRLIGTLQWCCIALQVFGMIVAQHDPCESKGRFLIDDYMALLLLVFIASLSSMWNESLIKNYKIDLAIQNMSLYVFGFIFNFFGYILDSTTLHPGYTFFQGYNFSTFIVVLMNSVVGVVITAVYKYADAITKTIAYAFTTCLLLMISSVFYGMEMNISIVCGCLVVYVSTYIYFVNGSKDLDEYKQKANVKDGILEPSTIFAVSLVSLFIAFYVEYRQLLRVLEESTDE